MAENVLKDFSGNMSSESDNSDVGEAVDDYTVTEEVLESIAGCSCKSRCSIPLKETEGKRRGCPCKGYKLKCGSNCKCGTAKNPCVNRARPEPTTPATSENDERNERSVESILKSLNHEQLLEFAVVAFTSRRLLLNDLLTNMDGGGTSGPQPSVIPPFCVCGCCREMPTDKERVCCKERRRCRSKTDSFSNICIDSDNISTAIRSLADTYVFTPVYDNRAMRHAAYRQYVMWQHGHLGKGHRVVIPSCCVWKIRTHYPSPDGQYTGYKGRR